MLLKRVKSIVIAAKGIIVLIKEEDNAKVHLFATFVVVSLGYFLGLTANEWCLIALCIVGVFSAEAMNTAVETLTDMVSPDFHPLAGKTKDFAAAAVLLFSIGAAIVGLIIFLPKILKFF